MHDISDRADAVIHIHREHSYVGAAVRFHVHLDKEEVGSLENGGHLDIPVSAGIHTVEVKSRILGLPNTSDLLRVIVTAQEVVRLRCGFKAFGHFLEPDSSAAGDLGESGRGKATHEPPQIVLDDQVEKVRAATEDVSVPSGVTIRVTRARTIEHTIEFEHTGSGEGSIEPKLAEWINISIRGHVEEKTGKTLKESETVSYEIELNGKDAPKYQLVGTDVWRSGRVSIAGLHSGRFRFRESAELEVIPIRNAP